MDLGVGGKAEKSFVYSPSPAKGAIIPPLLPRSLIFFPKEAKNRGVCVCVKFLQFLNVATTSILVSHGGPNASPCLVPSCDLLSRSRGGSRGWGGIKNQNQHTKVIPK